MRITIAERLRPFSHQPGCYCILPGSTLRLQVFPALLRVFDMKSAYPRLIQEFAWDIQGPVVDFTVQQDLEKGYVRVWGRTQAGFMRYIVRAAEESTVEIEFEKNPQNAITAEQNVTMEKYRAPLGERLSLGCHKAQDWEMIRRRLDMTEIFPHWFRLGQLIAIQESSNAEGTLALMSEEEKPENAIPLFKKIFLASFEGLLSPRLEDEDHHGLHLPPLSKDFNGSPLQILTRGAALIRRLFVTHESTMLHLLPCLPPEFHCGRMIGIRWDTVGEVDIEWSKKCLRRVVLRSTMEGEARFIFPKALKSYRLRRGNSDKGRRFSCQDAILSLPQEEYFLDNFQH